jgi:O-antigen/teichoic acid export membrane protein
VSSREEGLAARIPIVQGTLRRKEARSYAVNCNPNHHARQIVAKSVCDDPLWIRHLPAPLRARLSGRTHLHAAIQGSAWLFVDKLLRMVLGLFIGTWVARYLGPSNYGELAYLLTYIAFFQAVATLGADGIVVRDIAANRVSPPHILGTACLLRFVVGLICALIAVGGMTWSKGIHDPSVVLIGLASGALLFQSADTVGLWFQSQGQNKRLVLCRLAAAFISAAIKVLLIVLGAPLAAFAAVIALESMLSAAALLIAYRTFRTAQGWRHISKLGREMLSEAWPYLVSGMSVVVYMRIDQMMIKSVLGSNDLGMYVAAVTVSQVWHFIPVVIVGSLAPLIAQKKLQGSAEYSQALLAVFRLFGALSVCLSVLTATLAGPLITVLYGKSFEPAARVLAVHVFTNIFVFLGVAQSLWMLNDRRGFVSLYKTLIGAGTAVACNLWLLPIYGLIGAAISAVLSYAASAVLCNLLIAPQIFRMQLGLRPKPLES